MRRPSAADVSRRNPDGDAAGAACHSDSGTATVLAAMISIGLLAVLWLCVQLGAATITRHRVAGAADLAALSAAAHAPMGAERACARAEWVVRSMRAVMLSCQLSGAHSQVEARAAPWEASSIMAANARARAGPVDPRVGTGER